MRVTTPELPRDRSLAVATLLVRAPDHLGDGVQALPAIEALSRAYPTAVAGPSWRRDLYAHTGVAFEPRGDEEIAVLLKPSFKAAWSVRGIARRVGLATAHRRLLLTDAVTPPGPHRTDDYAAICRAIGVRVEGAPSFPADVARAPVTLPEGAVLLLPGTRSAETVRWRGFHALATALGDRAVVVVGPGDLPDALAVVPSDTRLVGPLDVPQVAALAIAARAVVGLDSGLTHLAAAARRSRGLADVHVVYGSTDARHTGPPGTREHHGTRPPCWPCYRKQCPYGGPCLDADVRAVLEALA
jgi:ADP-heptose:LPS heptosyltransferase